MGSGSREKIAALGEHAGPYSTRIDGSCLLFILLLDGQTTAKPSKTALNPETNSTLNFTSPSKDGHEDIDSQSPGLGSLSHGYDLGPFGYGCGGHRYRLLQLLCEQVCHHICLVKGQNQRHDQEHYNDFESAQARPLLQFQLQRVYQGPLQRPHRVQDLWGE